MKSRTGRTTLLTRLLRAAQIPTGTPIATANAVATTTTARVCMASVHRPMNRISRNASRVNTPKPHLRSSSASTTNTAMTMYGLGAVRITSTMSSRNSITAEMAENSGPKFAVSQSTRAPTGAPMLISGIAVLPAGVLGAGVLGAGVLGAGAGLVWSGEGLEQGRARDDAEQPPVVVGD